jgi:hypothetical protein
LNYATVQENGVVELYIDRRDEAENKRIFDHIFAQPPSAKSDCYPRGGIVMPKGCYPMAFVLG